MITLPPDPYSALGVSKDANLQEIRSAYKKLALRCHPDKVQGEDLKAAKQDEFTRLQQAYELLSDDKERAKYDDQANLREQLRNAAPKSPSGASASRTPPRGMYHPFDRAGSYKTSPQQTPPGAPKAYHHAARSYEDHINAAPLRSSDEATQHKARRTTSYENYDRQSRRDEERARRKKKEEEEMERSERDRLRKAERKRSDKERRRESEEKRRSPYIESYDDDDADATPPPPPPSRSERKKSSSGGSGRKHVERRERSRLREDLAAAAAAAHATPVVAAATAASSPEPVALEEDKDKAEHAYEYAALYLKNSYYSKKVPNFRRSQTDPPYTTPPAPTPPPIDDLVDDQPRRSSARSSARRPSYEKPSPHKKSPSFPKDTAMTPQLVVEGASPTTPPTANAIPPLAKSFTLPPESPPRYLNRSYTDDYPRPEPMPSMLRSHTWNDGRRSRSRSRNPQASWAEEDSEDDRRPVSRHHSRRSLSPNDPACQRCCYEMEMPAEPMLAGYYDSHRGHRSSPPTHYYAGPSGAASGHHPHHHPPLHSTRVMYDGAPQSSPTSSRGGMGYAPSNMSSSPPFGQIRTAPHFTRDNIIYSHVARRDDPDWVRAS